MRWEGRRESRNIEDRRGSRPGRAVVGGGLGALVIAVIAMFLGVDPSQILPVEGPSAGVEQSEPVQESAEEAEQRRMVSVVLADTEETWNTVFQQAGYDYREPRLVLFREAVESACGVAGSAVGPFYCPADQRVFLDLSFFDELATRFGAPGEFARAYVIAHEVGHHVQHLLGYSERVRALQQRASQAQANTLSVLLELQADCFAGVWAHRAARERDFLEAGDLEAGLRAAAAVGDDTIQRRAQGRVVPESFTHGTSEQRMTWFRRGFTSGDPNTCDTFEGRLR